MANLSYSTQLIEQDDIDAIVSVLEGNLLAQGPQVAAFEAALCRYTGAKYAICFNSATSALSGAYSACGIDKGDEIITTPISFVTTANMFVTVGATPVWCDVKADGNIDETKIEALITPKTKAIVPVHFAGKPLNIQKIHAVAKKHKLLVIEDAAHALGSSIDGKKIGSFSDMTLFSFHAIKPITTGEGGAILTDNEEYANKLRLFRSHGMLKKGLWHSDMVSMGHNYRLTEVAAALGLSQLKKLNSFIELRNKIASYYDETFHNATAFTSIAIDKENISSRHLYPILLKNELLTKKETIFEKLQARGLGVQVHYRPIYENSFYKEKFGEYFLVGADRFYKQEISIPCHHNMTLEDAKHVATIILEVVQG